MTAIVLNFTFRPYLSIQLRQQIGYTDTFLRRHFLYTGRSYEHILVILQRTGYQTA